jgi:putative salt-induced outer membrane protein YdiY
VDDDEDVMKNLPMNGYRAALIAALGLGTMGLPALRAQDAEAAEPTVEEEEKPKWESSAGVSFAYASGNTENVLFTGNFGTERLGEVNEWRFGASAGYGESKPRDDGDPTTEENREQNTGFARGFGQYNRLFSERFYGLVRAEAIHDSIADINYRIPVSAGVGYYFIKEEKVTLSADVGPGYVWEKVGGVSDEYASLRAGEQFEWKISESSRLWQSLEYTPEITDFSNSVIEFELGVESKLYGNLSMRVVAQNTYRTEPALISDPGVSPEIRRKHNDFRLLAGLQYTF